MKLLQDESFFLVFTTDIFFFFGEAEVCRGYTLNSSTKKHIPEKSAPKTSSWGHRVGCSVVVWFQSTFAAYACSVSLPPPLSQPLSNMRLRQMVQDVPYLHIKPLSSCWLSRHQGHLCQRMKIFRAMVVVTISAHLQWIDLRTVDHLSQNSCFPLPCFLTFSWKSGLCLWAGRDNEWLPRIFFLKILKQGFCILKQPFLLTSVRCEGSIATTSTTFLSS